MRTNSHEFDWYAFSKLNPEHPNLHTFKELIDGAGLTPAEITKVPVSHRNKLLVAFQNVSKEMKERMEQSALEMQQVEFDKKMVRDQMHILKG